MQNPNFHGKKQNTDKVMGFCRPNAFDPFTHFHDQLYSGYGVIIILVCKKYEYDKQKHYQEVILCDRFCKTQVRKKAMTWLDRLFGYFE